LFLSKQSSLAWMNNVIAVGIDGAVANREITPLSGPFQSCNNLFPDSNHGSIWD